MPKYLLLALSLLLLASCHLHETQPPFFAKFNNQLYTDIRVSVAGYGSQVVRPGQTATFRIDRADQSYSYSAVTHGATADGGVIGTVLEWTRTNDIYGNSYTSYLITNPDIFFLRMRNTGHHNLRPLYVNHGLADESLDNIIIPGNGTTYNTGYYNAHANTRVQAYWMDMPSDYTYWEHRTHFNFPWTENQSVTLLNDFKKGGELGFESSANPLKVNEDEPHGFHTATPKR